MVFFRRSSSTKAKMTLAVSLLVMILLTVTGLLAFGYFQRSLEETVARQQFTLATVLAEEVDGKLLATQEHLQAMARMAPEEILTNPKQSRRFLASQAADLTLFDHALFLFSPAGLLLASVPTDPASGTGPNSPYAPVLARTRLSRAPQISEPFATPGQSRPIIVFTAPILDRQGEVAAILAGSLDLQQDNFLGHLARLALGGEGSLQLLDRAGRLLVHPDAAQILQPAFVAEGDRLFARALAGFEGTGASLNRQGVEVLCSFKRLSTTGWILAVKYPVAEAFAPIETARRTFLAASIVSLLFASVVVWLLMHYLTAPLGRLARQVAAMQENDAKLPLSWSAGRDEIGALARSFSGMLERMATHRRSLSEQLHFLQVLIDALPNPVFYKDAQGRYLGCNTAFETCIGSARQELVGRSVYDLAPADLAETYRRADDELFAQGPGGIQTYEASVQYADGVRRPVIFYKANFPTPEGGLGGLVGTILDISERRRMEEELAEQRRFSENLLAGAATPIFVLDTGHRVIAWNRACEELTGIPASAILGTDGHQRAFYNQLRPCLADHLLGVVPAELPATFRNCRPSPLAPDGWMAEGWIPLGGRNRYLIFNAAPICNSRGEIVAAIETLEDITPRKKAEEGLEESLSLLQATLESTADGILVVDWRGKISSHNRRFLEMWRLSDDLLVERLDDRIITPILEQLEDSRAFLTRVRHLFSHPEEESLETLRFKDGRIFEHLSRPQRLGEAIVGRVWSFRDITFQQHTLDQLRKLVLAVEQSPNMVMITDAAGAIEYVNARFVAVTGYQPGEVLGKNPRLLTAGDTSKEYYQTLWQTIGAGHEWRGEFHNRRRNGELYWESALISPVKNGEGAIRHFVAIKEDITGKTLAERHRQLTRQVLSLLSLQNERGDKIRDILQLIQDFTGCEAIGIRLQEEEDFPYHQTIGLPAAFLAAENLLLAQGGKLADCLCGQVLLGLTGTASPDGTEAGSFFLNTVTGPAAKTGTLGECRRGECACQEYRSLAFIPLRCGEEIIGLLQLFDRQGGKISLDLVKILEEVGNSIGIALEHRQAQARLLEREGWVQFLSHYDPLTRLPNRDLLHDRLQHALAKARRNGKQVALLLLDLDRFKTINDSLGHELGDRLLVKVANRLLTLVRDADTLARFSGDEFAVLLEDVDDLKRVIPVAQAILQNLSQAFTLDDYQLYLTASLGISLFPSDGDDLQSLLKYAEVAMYRAKELGGNSYQFYRPEMNARSREMLLLESNLRQALEHQQLVLFYQPKIDLLTGTMAGTEALLRWRHPELGLMSPADFIPLAEETGMIVPIGEWVLRSACAQAGRWATEGSTSARVAVNISGRQFKQPDFVELVGRVLHETALPPHFLELEITENVVMEDVDATIETLARLKKMGVRLTIDDFGTGYSSLSYLKRFPIDCLKIDRGFVRDIIRNPNDAAIAAAIIALARAMRLTVVAEGVETVEQLDVLRLAGCDLAQGYLFSRPVPAGDLDGAPLRTDWLPRTAPANPPEAPPP